MATIHDVAQMAGVSISTVSNVINRNGNVAARTEARVLEAIRTLDYVPDYLLRSKRSSLSKNIGIITEDIAVIFSARITQGICDYCSQHGLSTMITNLNLRLRSGKWEAYKNELGDYLYEELVKDPAFLKMLGNALDDLKKNSIRGIIYVGEHPRDISPLISEFGLPCTAVFSYTKRDSGCYCVNNDDEHGAMLAVEHLIANGHDRIAVVTGETTSLATHKRLIGYQNALMKHRIPLNPSYVYSGTWGSRSGAEALVQLMKLDVPPTAIFVMNDIQAGALLNKAHELHLKIPEDLSVIGFDDIEASNYTYPPLTTIHTPFEEMGYTAAEKLIERLDHPDDAYSTLLQCRLVERSTVARLKR